MMPCAHLLRAAASTAALVSLFLLSCSDDDLSPHVKSLDEMYCIEISIIDGSCQFNGKGGFWGEGVVCQITPNLHAPHASDNWDGLVIKFPQYYDGYVQRPGTFDLGSDTNTNHRICRQSVEVLQDVSGDHIQVRNFQVKGTMILDSISPATGESAGKLVDVYFREIAETGFFEWGGYTGYDTSLHLACAEWSTYADVIRPCEKWGPPNAKLQVCDPVTGLSVRAQCFSDDSACPGGGQCVIQAPNYGVGACYPTCVPFTASCGSGFECVSTSFTNDRGICKKQDTLAEGEYCRGSYLTTSCQKGMVCGTRAPYWEYQNQCYEQCDYFGSPSNCSSGRVCALAMFSLEDYANYCYLGRCIKGGLCVQEEYVDTADIGEECWQSDGCPCASDGVKALGIGVKEGDKVICRKLARFGSADCPPGTICDTLKLLQSWRGYFIPRDVGVCR